MPSKKYIAIFKCPNCEHLDQHVDYNVNSTSNEYGTASPVINENGLMQINNLDYEYSDQGDSDWDGSPVMQCNECNEEMSKQETLDNYTVYTLTENEFLELRNGDIDLEDIVEEKKKGKKGKSTIKTTEKPDCDAFNLIMKPTGGTECIEGFNAHGAECPKCHAILSRLDKEIELTCNECGHEFNIRKLTAETYA